MLKSEKQKLIRKQIKRSMSYIKNFSKLSENDL